MPTVLIFEGYRFFFYCNENDEPPHIHVERQNGEAKFWLEGAVEVWSRGFANHELTKIREMIIVHRKQLGRAWRTCFGY